MVVVGVDAHKRTHTLVAIDEVGRKLAEKTVASTTTNRRVVESSSICGSVDQIVGASSYGLRFRFTSDPD
jgi:hypothetical protein